MRSGPLLHLQNTHAAPARTHVTRADFNKMVGVARRRPVIAVTVDGSGAANHGGPDLTPGAAQHSTPLVSRSDSQTLGIGSAVVSSRWFVPLSL